MGRAGVTLVDIEKAALQLQGRGKNPTVDAVREVLGTGSKSTIAQHLKSWKSQQSDMQGKLPHELSALVTGLWERLHEQAEQRIIESEALNDQRVQEVRQELQLTQKQFENLKITHHQLEEASATLRIENLELDKELVHEKKEQAKLNERYQALTQQMENAKEENMRLHQLAANIQSNLEHYQQAMQELRTEQQLAMDKQQSAFQQELSDRQRQLTLINNTVQEQERLLNAKINESVRLVEQLEILKADHTKLSQLFDEKTRELIIYKERSDQQDKELKRLLTELDVKRNLAYSTEKQAAILSSQVDQLQKTLAQAEDKIEALRQEKLFLIKEKAELQGYLKQIEKVRRS